MSKQLAVMASDTVLKLLLAGVYQPVMREGAIRVMHCFDKLDGVECTSCG